jgi:glutathione transport system permease protein
MRLLNWRRQAVLNAMPGLKPDHIRTPWLEFWRRFRRQPVAMTAGLFVLLLIVVAILARGWPRLMRKTTLITTA